MIDFKKIYKTIIEDGDAGGAIGGGEASSGSTSGVDGEITSPSTGSNDIVSDKNGITSNDVLGKCDHNKDGYLGVNCFHIPTKIKCPLKRQQQLAYGGSKRKKKTPYEKGMVILTDSDKQDLIDNAKNKAPEKVKNLASKVKSEKDVQKALDAYEKKQSNVYDKLKRGASSSSFKTLKNNINDTVSLLKDVLNKKYKVQWSTIAILTAGLVYAFSPVDLIPDVIPVIGVVDDITVLYYVFNALKDELEKYREWKEENNRL